MVVPYVFGNFGYGVATAALYSACVTRFDQVNGRVNVARGETATVTPPSDKNFDESAPQPPL
jgi:hypothetical protein